jgi:pimeloyl-ACP methyl ester carboxylesterase
VSAPFGPHTAAQWRKLTTDVMVNDGAGWRRHYDPALSLAFQSGTVESTRQAETLMWAAYDAIDCPTLVVRGAMSDLLSADVAQQMTRRGPQAALVEIAGTGHAPTFVDAAQIEIARSFLLG